MDLIGGLQAAGVIWAINTASSVDLPRVRADDFCFPFRPDFILTSERDVFRPGSNGTKWEAFGDWNERCARDPLSSYIRLIGSCRGSRFCESENKSSHYLRADGPAGLIAGSEEEMDRVTEFIEQARRKQTKFSYHATRSICAFARRFMTKARRCRVGSMLQIPRRHFAAEIIHKRYFHVDGEVAAMPALSGNAIREVKEAVARPVAMLAGREHGGRRL